MKQISAWPSFSEMSKLIVVPVHSVLSLVKSKASFGVWSTEKLVVKP